LAKRENRKLLLDESITNHRCCSWVNNHGGPSI
jgi:hypothetical protein